MSDQLTNAIIHRLQRGNVNYVTLRLLAAMLGLSGRRESPDAGAPTAPTPQKTDTGSPTQHKATQRAGNWWV